jgi:hypothetical protein
VTALLTRRLLTRRSWHRNHPAILASIFLLIQLGGQVMPRGDKSSYSDKQKRMAEHIEESEKERGASEKTAARIGWATVNKLTGGAKKKSAKSSTKRKTTKSKAARGKSK